MIIALLHCACVKAVQSDHMHEPAKSPNSAHTLVVLALHQVNAILARETSFGFVVQRLDSDKHSKEGPARSTLHIGSCFRLCRC